jgi:hypothetical protein
MKSAAKKWRSFKHFLKSKYWKSEFSVKENCDNGCGDRIPEEQWEKLVKNWRTEESMVSAYLFAGIVHLLDL